MWYFYLLGKSVVFKRINISLMRILEMISYDFEKFTKFKGSIQLNIILFDNIQNYLII